MSITEVFVIFNIILNLILSLIIIVWDLYFYFKMNEKEKWTKILYMLVGLIWFIRYSLFLLDIEPFSTEKFNPILVWMVSFTLLALAIGSIIRVQRIVGFAGMKTDVKRLINRIKRWTSKTF